MIYNLSRSRFPRFDKHLPNSSDTRWIEKFFFDFAVEISQVFRLDYFSFKKSNESWKTRNCNFFFDSLIIFYQVSTHSRMKVSLWPINFHDRREWIMGIRKHHNMALIIQILTNLWIVLLNLRNILFYNSENASLQS